MHFIEKIGKNLQNKMWISNHTSTTQSLSMETPSANPASLSIAPAITSTMNQGLRSKADVEVRPAFLRAYMTIAADIN